MGMLGTRRPKRLKPAGHSATIEALIQPAIVIASTLMSAIAAYVLAYDEISKLLANRGNWQDAFVIALCIGMGFLIDMAIIVSATRYKMHAVRNDPREERWLKLAKWVLIIGLTSETMTLFYFFVSLDPAGYPSWLVWAAGQIHAFLVTARAFLPPVVVAYFAAGVLPVSFDRADRNREIKTRTSSNVMTLIDRLSYVEDTDDKAEMLQALGGQLVLDTYATYDETARTTEDEQLQRDAKLLAHMARMHNLDWSQLGAHVAPELVTTPRRIDRAFTRTPLTEQQMGMAAENTVHLQPPIHPNAFAQSATMPHKAIERALSPREQRRLALEADMYGVRGHPTSPRESVAYDDMDEFSIDELGDDWQDEDERVLRNGHLPEMSQHSAKRDRAQAAYMAPVEATLTVREFVMPDLPPSKYEKDDDTDQRRAVFRVLDQALAKHESVTRKEVAKRAGVSENTVRSARPLWDERRSKRGQKRAAPLTEELAAITPEMLATR